MKVGVIITTYNWTEALVKVLVSIRDQSYLPDEIVVCDDGSQSECKNYILDLFKNFPCILKYVWQEDKGFRAASIRNKGINELSTDIDYVILIDGDMILHKNFVKNHLNNSEKNCFVQGGRVLISQKRTIEILKDLQSEDYFYFYTRGLFNRQNSIYMPFLTKFFKKPNQNLEGIRACNMSFWREDLFEVNGFNEDFVGWGGEDSEFGARLINLGCKRRDLRFKAIGYHIHHEGASRAMLDKNHKIFLDTVNKKLDWCSNGIDKYLYKT